MFSAFIAASAQLAVPLPSGVPATLQTLSIALCGYCLGIKRSISAVLVYILLGLAGAPVFSGFSGGVASPFTKESLLYREIFEKYYPGQAEMVTDFWMPNRSWVGCKVNDPSARVLANYGDSGQ